MNRIIYNTKKARVIASRVLIICFSILGGYGGSSLYSINASVKNQKIIADNEREHIQVTTQNMMEKYVAPSTGDNNGSATRILLAKDDTSAIAEKTANLVSTKLINSSIAGLATKKEVAELEIKISDMFNSYELSDSQKEDLSKSVAAMIELDLTNLNKNTNNQTTLSDAAYKNINDLQTKAASLQNQIDTINAKLSDLVTDTNTIQNAINSPLEGYASSEQTSTLQSKVDKLNAQYDDILSKYNKQTEKLQALIKDNTNTDASETLKEQISSLKSALSKLQESATSEISALETRIKEIEKTPNNELIDGLEAKILEQQEQITTYKSNIQSLNRTVTDLNAQLNTLSENDEDAREELQQKLQDTNDLLIKNQSDIDSATADIADMETEIDRLKNGTSDSIDTLQNQISAITSSLTEMDSTQKTLDELLNSLKETVGNSEAPVSGTIIGDLSNTQNALSLLEGRVSTLETKTQNIKSGVQIPFSFGIQDGKYGYYDDDSFMDFKSQSDINSAVSDAIGSMTGAAATNKYTVSAHGSDAYGTQDIKKNYDIAIAGSQSGSTFTVTANGQNVYSATVANTNSGTYTPTARSASLDMGTTNSYRYVNTNRVPNTNSGTYTYAANSTGGTIDLGATNTYRYVNASNVYAKGKADGDKKHTITATCQAVTNREKHYCYAKLWLSVDGEVVASGTTNDIWGNNAADLFSNTYTASGNY